MKVRNFLLVLLLVVMASAKAQTTMFDWENNDPVRTDTTATITEAPSAIETPTSNDTTARAIRGSECTWDNLDKRLQNKFYEFAGTADSVISKNSISWIFKVTNIPLNAGASTLYLCMLGSGENVTYFVTCKDPNAESQVQSCHYELPSGKHRRDDPIYKPKEYNGQNKTLPRNRRLPVNR